MVTARPVRRRPSPPSRRGSARQQGTRAVPPSPSVLTHDPQQAVPQPATQAVTWSAVPQPAPRAGTQPAPRAGTQPAPRAGTQPVIHPSASRRSTATCLVALAGLALALALPSPAVAAPETRSPGPDIEALSPYQGQATCDPVARPGVVAFRDLVLAAYPGPAGSGFVRACSSRGTSEHKQGRAWDWRVDAADPEQAAQAAELMAWLTAPDEHGTPAAMARRLGVMYVIWDSKVWKSYQAARGWQSYVGGSPHTDHVHLSFSWAGASRQTSYWAGPVAPGKRAPVPPTPTAPGPAPAPSGSPATRPATPAVPTAAESAPVDRRTGVTRRRGTVAGPPGPWKRH